jgi:hypothetical protein
LRCALDTRPGRDHVFNLRFYFRGTIVSAGAEGSYDMRRISSLLRSAPTRIGRRLAQIVAIAAASLPSAGA